MDSYTLVITHHVTLMYLCYLLIAISLIQVTSINLSLTIVSLFWTSP